MLVIHEGLGWAGLNFGYNLEQFGIQMNLWD